MNARILMIEDNEQNRYLATYLLEHHGHRVFSEPDGPSGLARALGEPFDLILRDIQLPGMDGYAVARALRANDATRCVPIIAVTSYAMAGDRENVFAAGCDGYLEKPIDPEHFVAQLSRFLPATSTGVQP